MTGTEYLQPLTVAATALDVKIYPPTIERLAAVLDRLSPRGFPMDVISKAEAFNLLRLDRGGDIEELELLLKVFPDWSGDVRYKLTADTLQWCWSSKKSGTYSTITVPFPTELPLTFEVQRFCDMDELENHSDLCCQREDEDSEDYSDSCDCESWIEQTARLTVASWTTENAEKVQAWLSSAVIEKVRNRRLP
jgi:hypothetical protein